MQTKCKQNNSQNLINFCNLYETRASIGLHVIRGRSQRTRFYSIFIAFKSFCASSQNQHKSIDCFHLCFYSVQSVFFSLANFMIWFCLISQDWFWSFCGCYPFALPSPCFWPFPAIVCVTRVLCEWDGKTRIRIARNWCHQVVS